MIGTGCIIEEGAIILNRSALSTVGWMQLTYAASVRRKEVMRIGNDNLFEIGCRTLHSTLLR